MTSPDNQDALRVYLREVLTVEPLREGEEADLLRQVRNQDNRAELALKRLLEANLHLVPPIAERNPAAGLSTLDLIQEGNLGLMRAIQTFSGDNKAFVADAATCIENAITKAIAESRSPRR